MPEPLTVLVRSNRLLSPTQREFCRKSWAAEYAKLDAGIETDAFYASVMWFADEIGTVRRKIDDLHLERFDHDALLREFCGRCNYGYVYSEAHLQLAILQAKPGELPMGSPAHVLFTTGTGDQGNADAFRTTATDSLGAALRHLSSIAGRRKGTTFGIAKAAETASHLFNALYVLEFYCERTVWQEWRVVDEAGAWRIQPPTRDPFELSSMAVNWRREQEHGEWSAVAGMAWQEGRGHPEITAMRGDPSGQFRTVLRTPGTGVIPPENVLRWMVQASDLEDVGSEPLPHFTDQTVTLNDLISAGLLFGSAGRVVVAELMRLDPDTRLRQFAQALSPAVLDSLLVDLGWSNAKRAAVIDFFTFRGRSIDGVWPKPLVESRRGLVPIFPAIVGPNLYRSAELWLAEAGGGSLQRERGSSFEARARGKLIAALKASRLESVVSVAPGFSVKINGARRDIDLAFRIGKTVFVGEAKLKRFPAAPRENRRWIDELTKGAVQAKLRCEYFFNDPRALVQNTAFAGQGSELEFVPFVLASGSFGAGVKIEGVPVLDFDGFIEFFDPGFFGAKGELQPGGEMRAINVVPYRSDDCDLALCFKAYLAEPVRVRVIEEAMVPLDRTLGLKAIDGRSIFCTDPMVDHRRFTPDHSEWLFATADRIWKTAVAAQVLSAAW